MKKTILVMAALSLLLACNNSKTTKEKESERTGDTQRTAPPTPTDQITKGSGNYSIDAPEGWDKIDTTYNGEHITFIRSPREGADDNFLENVNVITEKVGSMSMDEYLEKNMTSMENGLTDFEKKDQSSRTINGHDFRIFFYSHNYQGTPIDGEVFFTINDGTAYVITCSARKGEIKEWEGRFDRVVNTFKLD
jgi:hypothetical protein